MRRTWALLAAGVATVAAVAAAPSPAQAATLCNGLTATIVGTAAGETLNGTAAPDVIAGLGGNDTINGLDGDDTICPGAGNDVVNGGAGADTFVAEATADGADRFVGGPAGSIDGTDTVTYAARTAAVNVDLNEIADDGLPGEGDFVDANSIESVEGGSGNDVLRITFTSLQYGLIGGPGNDTLTGNWLVVGGPGDDTMTFLAGTSGTFMSGGDGTDTLTDNTQSGSNLSGGAGNDTIFAGTGSNTLFGDDGNDTLVGGTGPNTVIGGAGNDTITGGLGDDNISGGDGNDTINATIVVDGSDFISGGNGVDTANYQGRNNAGRGTTLSLSLDGVTNDGEPNERDNILADVENVKGGTGHNFITGNNQANLLEGNQNADTIIGLDGISGNDVIISHNFGGDFCTFDPGDTVSC
jgi:Ca2+-binding RTX toxin-like protein